MKIKRKYKSQQRKKDIGDRGSTNYNKLKFDTYISFQTLFVLNKI